MVFKNWNNCTTYFYTLFTSMSSRYTMEKIEYFDYQKVAKDMHIPNVILKEIEKEVKKAFPKDKMMYELHVLRAIKSKYWKKTTK